MKVRDSFIGTLLLLLAGFLFWQTLDFPVIPGQIIGPRAFPQLLCTLLGICSVLMIAKDLKQTQPWMEIDAWMRSPGHILRAAAIPAALAFYIAFSDRLGFLPCATLIVFSLMVVLGVTLRRAAIVAPLAAIVVHLLFYKLFHIPLPWGPLPVLW